MITKEWFDFVTSHFSADLNPGWDDKMINCCLTEGFYVAGAGGFWAIQLQTSCDCASFYLLSGFETRESCEKAYEFAKSVDPFLFV